MNKKKKTSAYSYESMDFYVAFTFNGAHMESPEDQGLSKRDDRRSLVRAFVTEREAWTYVDSISPYTGSVSKDGRFIPWKLDVKKLNYHQLKGLQFMANDLSMNRHKARCEIGLCSIEYHEWPVLLEIV